MLDFVAAMERCTLREAALILQHRTDRLPTQRTTLQLVTRKSKVPLPLGFALRAIDPTHPYLAARGIEIPTAQEFGIGFYGGSGIFSGQLVIPIHNERGELVAYCGRALDCAQPRYRFPSGFPKSEILFNFHRAAAWGRQAVVLVEGFFDCLKLHQAGVCSVVALMGAALYSSQQRLLLERFRRVILMLDGDDAGRRATTAIAARLQPHASVRVIHLPDAVQPDQLSSQAIRHFLQGQTEPVALSRAC